jgi:arylsulfatase A-like enzyme
MPRAALLPCALLLTACGGSAPQPTGPLRPRNAVVFTVDTLRADQLGAYGRRPSHTPHFDALAQRSLLFERCYSPATLTNPALTSLWTGLLPFQHGVHEQSMGFAKGIVPIPHLLAEHGLATGAFLANMCKLQEIPGTVFHDGWQERFCGMLDAPEAYSDQYLWDEAVVGACLAWIEARGQAPFLAWAHLMDPHAEHRPPPRRWDAAQRPLEDRFEQYAYYNRFEELRQMPPPEVIERLLELYAAEVAGADDQLGRLLAGLERLGLEEHTALIASADHGEELFETWVRYDHGLSMTEGVFHVPLLIQAPGLAPGRVAEPVELSQIGPTLLELFGVEGLYEFPAASLLAEAPSRGFAMSYAGRFAASLRTQKFRYWKRLKAPLPERDSSPWRLEAPWFSAPQLLARYETAGSLVPTFLPLEAESARDAERLGRRLEQFHGGLRRFGKAARIDSPELERMLSQLNYLRYSNAEDGPEDGTGKAPEGAPAQGTPDGSEAVAPSDADSEAPPQGNWDGG